MPCGLWPRSSYTWPSRPHAGFRSTEPALSAASSSARCCLREPQPLAGSPPCKFFLLETKKKETRLTWSSWRPCWRSPHRGRWRRRATARPRPATVARLSDQPADFVVFVWNFLLSKLTFPSLTLPLPRMMIFAPVSFSIFFNVFPRGPGGVTINYNHCHLVIGWTWHDMWFITMIDMSTRLALTWCLSFPLKMAPAWCSFQNLSSSARSRPIRRPTKLMSGCSSCGIITLSDTFTVGALRNKSIKCNLQILKS